MLLREIVNLLLELCSHHLEVLILLLAVRCISDGRCEVSLIEGLVLLELLKPDREGTALVVTLARGGLLENNDLLKFLVERPDNFLQRINNSHVDQFETLAEGNELSLALHDLVSNCDLLLHLGTLFIGRCLLIYFSVGYLSDDVMYGGELLPLLLDVRAAIFTTEEGFQRVI